MAAQKGISCLIKRGDAASPEVFTNLGGLRATSIRINKETVDVTTKSHTDRYRRLLAGAGVKSISLSGSGLFENDTAVSELVNDILGSTFDNYQIVVPGLGTFEAAFDLSGLEFGGDHNDAVSFSGTLESAGAVTFSAS